ncbi:MAG: hypothetical protein V4671_23880 [Armatimonadota bacterium]
MTWYKIHLSHDEVLDDAQPPIQKEYEQIHITAGNPSDAALFSSVADTEGTDLYFSPGAVSIATALLLEFEAQPCEKPASQITGILVGHADSFQLLEDELLQDKKGLFE